MGTETYKLGEALQHLCQLFTCIFSGRQRLYVVHTATNTDRYGTHLQILLSRNIQWLNACMPKAEISECAQTASFDSGLS